MSEIPDPEDVLRNMEQQVADKQEAQEELPPATTLQIDCKDQRGNEYKGEFYYTVPNLGARLRIGNMKLGYLPAGEPPDMTALQLVHMICYLTVSITFNEKFSKPHWWEFWKLYDATPFTALYTEATLYESKFLGEHERLGDAEGADQGEDAGIGGDDPADVGRKVQPPAQRSETLAANG